MNTKAPKTFVVALGGNSILRADEKGTFVSSGNIKLRGAVSKCLLTLRKEESIIRTANTNKEVG